MCRVFCFSGALSIVTVAVLFCALEIAPVSLSAASVNALISTRLEDPGDADPPVLHLNWGFDTVGIQALLDVTTMPGQDASIRSLEGIHAFLKTSYLELGAFAGPDYWYTLSGSISRLELLLPSYTSRVRQQAGDELPLSLSAIPLSSNTTSLAIGVGIPGYVSSFFLRSIGGDYAGWDHTGVLARLPLQGMEAETLWQLNISAAWYHSWFVPTATLHGWVPSEAEGAGVVLIRKDEDWWLDRALLRPGELNHLQCAVDLSLPWMQAIVLFQESLPFRFVPGSSLGSALALRLPLSDATGLPVLGIEVSGMLNLKDYRDMRGLAATNEGAFSALARLQLDKGFELNVSTGRQAEPLSDPLLLAEEYQQWNHDWHIGALWFGPGGGLGLTGSMEYGQDSAGGQKQAFSCATMAHANGRQVLGMLEGKKVNMEGSVRGDAELGWGGATTGEATIDRLGLQVRADSELNWRTISLAGQLYARLSAPGDWWAGKAAEIVGLDKRATVSLSLDFDFRWAVPELGSVELKAKVGLPEGSTVESVTHHASAGWPWFRKALEFSFKP